MPDAPGLELIALEINSVCEGAVTETALEHGRATLIVDPAKVLDALGWLRDTPGQEYAFCSSVHAADYLPAVPRFAVHYELLNRDRVERVNVKALLPDPSPVRPMVGRQHRAEPQPRMAKPSCPASRAASSSSPRLSSRSGRPTTCSASSSRATPTCGGS